MATYIKNKGVTQTVFSNNNHKTRNEIKWNAAYDGDHANIKVDLNDNGKKNKYRMQLNNKDLANLLSIPAVNKPLESRLQQDFLSDFDFLDEEDMELLPKTQFQSIQIPIQLQPQLQSQLQPQLQPHCYKPRAEFPPDSALFRVTIPDLKEKKEAFKSPFPTPCPYTSDICSLSELPELTSLSSIKSPPLLSDTDTDTHTDTISSEPLTNPLISAPLEPTPEQIIRPRLTKREKNARLNTPSPKTLRIHYTTASAKGRGTRRKKKQSGFAKFFKKLF
jgi:hypothetical protein